MNDYHFASRTYTGWYDIKSIRPTGFPVSGDKLNVPVEATHMGVVPWSRPSTRSSEERVFIKNGMAQFWSIDSAKEFLLNHTRGTIFQQVAETLEWPLEAVYKVRYRTKAWPCNWETYEQFFVEPAEVVEFLANRREWTLCEDNYFEVVSIEEWDLGPNLISEKDLVKS